MIDSAPILYVDLSSRRVWTEPMGDGDRKLLLGGRGWAASTLWRLTSGSTKPDSPENPLILAAGALAGTHAPSAGRLTVVSLSPATRLYLKSSSGEHFAHELRFAGYSALVVIGKSEKPTCLLIRDGEVEIVDASEIWGKDVRETTLAVQELMGANDAQVGCIGPAGEKGVHFSSLMFNIYSAAARGGPGAVMGSKNLKAIGVRGSGVVKVADPKGFRDMVVTLRKAVSQDSASHGLSEFGTAGVVTGVNVIQCFPTNNFQKSYLEGYESISGEHLKEAGYVKRHAACASCGIGCHIYTEVDSGTYAGSYSGGPEYETLAAFGGGCGITDPEALIRINEVCNMLGLDTISAGSVVQWVMETFERGLLSESDLDGIGPRWGDVHAVLKIISMIAERRGFGDVLARGVAHAAEVVGGDSWKWAIEVKGLEQSRIETRVRKGVALAFAVNPRGPDHLYGWCVAESARTPEARILIGKICGDEKYANPKLLEKRADIVKWHEDVFAAAECMGICIYTCILGYALGPEEMAQMYNLATGSNLSEDELMLVGSRIVNLERCINVRRGASRADDRLPWRLMNEPMGEGPHEGMINSEQELNQMLDEYYALRSWNLATGIPEAKGLRRLGLGKIADELESLRGRSQ